ncbi:hypothetical protein LMG9964_05565 [Paraburkholderia phenoliruptrix]|nr:hypothetical protein LMG9964_05565 [Paraburkholderia phenoliruptrix]
MIERIGMTDRWSDAVLAGNILFIAGHTADKYRSHSVFAQTQEVLSLLDITLSKSGMTKVNLVTVQIFLSDITKIDEMNKAWDGWVAKSAAPSRATVEARLASPEIAVEITGIAFR